MKKLKEAKEKDGYPFREYLVCVAKCEIVEDNFYINKKLVAPIRCYQLFIFSMV